MLEAMTAMWLMCSGATDCHLHVTPTNVVVYETGSNQIMECKIINAAKARCTKWEAEDA